MPSLSRRRAHASLALPPPVLGTGAGLAPLRVHDLRHTAVSLWIAEVANPKQVAVRAGHTSVSVVLDRDEHLYPHHDDDLMTALQRAGDT